MPILAAQSAIPGRIQGHLCMGFSIVDRHVAEALKLPINLGQGRRRPVSVSSHGAGDSHTKLKETGIGGTEGNTAKLRVQKTRTSCV